MDAAIFRMTVSRYPDKRGDESTTWTSAKDFAHSNPFFNYLENLISKGRADTGVLPKPFYYQTTVHPEVGRSEFVSLVDGREDNQDVPFWPHLIPDVDVIIGVDSTVPTSDSAFTSPSPRSPPPPTNSWPKASPASAATTPHPPSSSGSPTASSHAPRTTALPIRILPAGGRGLYWGRERDVYHLAHWGARLAFGRIAGSRVGLVDVGTIHYGSVCFVPFVYMCVLVEKKNIDRGTEELGPLPAAFRRYLYLVHPQMGPAGVSSCQPSARFPPPLLTPSKCVEIALAAALGWPSQEPHAAYIRSKSRKGDERKEKDHAMAVFGLVRVADEISNKDEVLDSDPAAASIPAGGTSLIMDTGGTCHISDDSLLVYNRCLPPRPRRAALRGGAPLAARESWVASLLPALAAPARVNHALASVTSAVVDSSTSSLASGVWHERRAAPSWVASCLCHVRFGYAGDTATAALTAGTAAGISAAASAMRLSSDPCSVFLATKATALP
ncbi:hypothetical protein BDK51DRAFT_50713 [Blyttiomyces helicus]|uniref:Uncharacterized protein n=1 Tax=Blyttiomyces helicus TaxID=388810 RepID=A0A4P9W277_9FUNG|nr:hypothetical protein BDK51DRAFT_50713 [Blyttiomyces helicus]|eukprot:RKO86319.1 hypothetical protein BDK51DRAFT_50713 [Blyttiomyces helicus]